MSQARLCLGGFLFGERQNTFPFGGVNSLVDPLELGLPVRHFAFPYGNVDHAGVRDFALCKEAGYETAVTTRMGAAYPDHAAHLHALPRVMVSSKYAEMRWLKVLASGLPGRMKNFGGRLNVA